MAAKKKEKGLWNLLDRIQGDKVIWIVVIFLSLLSVVALFSATSLDPAVLSGDKSRLDIFLVQLLMVCAGFLLMYGIYRIPGMKLFKFVSRYGFLISLFFLMPLFFHIDKGSIIRAEHINGAWRTLKIFGRVQLHVFEVVKVMMVMYLAWAVDSWKRNDFDWARRLSSRYNIFKWLSKPFWQGFMYVFLPIAICCVGIVSGSVSSALFVGVVMFATLFVGGFSIKDMIIYVGIIVGGIACGFGLYKAMPEGSGAEKMLGRVYERFDTAEGRMSSFTGDDMRDDSGKTLTIEELIAGAANANERQAIIDDKKQEYGALFAIREGGLLGKGPGRSTQKYVVPLIFGDYMFSFIIEEYGLWMAVLILIMYISLLARGGRIAMMCTKVYSRTVVGGLSLLISGQAMMHMMINVGIMPVTGQTLPIVSDGKSSLLMFYIAFGVMLSISKTAKKQMDEAIAKMESIIPTDVEMLDNIE